MLFGTIFIFDFLLLFVFNEFVSFLRIPKGARTITKGFTCSLECERDKFVFFFKKKIENPCSILSGPQQRRVLCRCVANINFLLSNFLVRSNVEPYGAASPFFHLRVRSSEDL